MLDIHTKAPEFSLPDQNGEIHSLSQYKGKWIVLYFYPRDDTPGCTKEACSFRDNIKDLTSKGVVVLGVSKDNVKSHKKFADKFTLNFPLLSDESKEMIQAFQVWGEKKFMGRIFDGIKRVTYLIDPEGKIAKVYPKVDPAIHTEEILKDLSEFV